jgi:hypothetical protein
MRRVGVQAEQLGDGQVPQVHAVRDHPQPGERRPREHATGQEEGQGDERGGGAKPAQSRALDDRLHRAPIAIAARHRHAEDGQSHPQREPDDLPGQGRGDEVRHHVARRGDLDRDAAEGHERERSELRPEPCPAARADAHATQRHRPERQQRVEHHLHAQAPGHRDTAADGLLGVDLEEEVVAPPVAAEHADDSGEDRQHGQRHPIGGDDAQDAPARVAHRAGRRDAVRARRHERAVEQEAGDDEELDQRLGSEHR